MKATLTVEPAPKGTPLLTTEQALAEKITGTETMASLESEELLIAVEGERALFGIRPSNPVSIREITERVIGEMQAVEAIEVDCARDGAHDQSGITYALLLGSLLAAHSRATTQSALTIHAANIEDTSVLRHAETIAECVDVSRQLVDEPGGTLGPEELAEKAAEIASNLGYGVVTETASQGGKYPGLAAVSAGSDRPGMMVVINTHDGKKSVALVGKGVTFDSGGLALKSPLPMYGMKADMAGVAAILGALHVSQRVAPDVPVTAYLPLAENMPGPSALRIGDIVHYPNDVSVEVSNPDAEGRLILADALLAASRGDHSDIVDLATLTESAITALGKDFGAIFATSDALANDLLRASESSLENLWRMPLHDRYESHNRSDVATVRNLPVTPYARSISAALFLKRFVRPDAAWAHLDIAGPAVPEGRANGFGAATLANFLSDRQSRLP